MVPVTIHLPLRDVVAALTTELMLETGRIVARDLTARFGIARPRLAVAGLNPHAGEDGALGDEDRDHRRAGGEAAAARRASTRIGPLPADTLFHERARATYDVAHVHVSRPGADPDQDAGLRPRGERDARPAVRAHLARPRHRLRHRRHRPADPSSLVAALALAARLAADDASAQPPQSNGANRRPAAAARGHPPAWPVRQKIPRPEFSARSQSDRAHRPRRRAARRARPWSRSAPDRAA